MSVPVPVAVKNRRFALFVCLTLLLCAVPMSGTVLRARAGRADAVIEGTVHDPSGKVVANAAVVVRNVSTDRVATATTDASGRFVVTGLAAGVYIVEVSASGFATSRRSGVRLEAGGSATLTFPLTVAPLSEQVTVTSTAPTAARSAPSQAPLDARSAESVISGEFISDFTSPVSDYSQVIAMAPGTFSVSPNGVGLGDTKTLLPRLQGRPVHDDVRRDSVQRHQRSDASFLGVLPDAVHRQHGVRSQPRLGRDHRAVELRGFRAPAVAAS